MNLKQRIQLELKEFASLSQSYSFARMKKQEGTEGETSEVTKKEVKSQKKDRE